MKWYDKTEEAAAYYKREGAPQDQAVLLECLKEVQEIQGGALDGQCIAWLAEKLRVKEAFLRAVIGKMPSLRFAETSHRLEICGNCKASAALRKYIEETFGVRSGGRSEKGGFSYQVTGCMKNCKNGPSVKWDGELLQKADAETLKKLLKNSDA